MHSQCLVALSQTGPIDSSSGGRLKVHPTWHIMIHRMLPNGCCDIKSRPCLPPSSLVCPRNAVRNIILITFQLCFPHRTSTQRGTHTALNASRTRTREGCANRRQVARMFHPFCDAASPSHHPFFRIAMKRTYLPNLLLQG